MSWYVFAQLNVFLTQQGYSPDFVSYVMTLPKHVQKAIGTELNKTPGLDESWLRRRIQTLLTQPIPQKQPKQVAMPVLEERFKKPGEKGVFYAKIPKEFVPWVNGLLNNPRFSFIPAEDGPRMFAALKNFQMLRNRPGIPLEKDINKYPDLLSLERELEKYVESGPKAGVIENDPARMPGVKVVKNLEDGSVVYQVSDPKSVAKLGVGTKWCTRADYPHCQADRYIKEYGYLYIVTKGGRPVLQMDPQLNQVMDINDEPTSLPRGLFDIFGERYAKKLGIPYKMLMQFSTEESANDQILLFKAIKENPRATVLASDQLKDDPQFMMDANKVGGEDALQYASERVLAIDGFEDNARRMRGEFDYDLGRSNSLDEDLEEIIYGNGMYGPTPLEKWVFDDAYDAVENYVSRRSRDGSGYAARGCGEVLGRTAVLSDIAGIKAGDFDIRKMKAKATQIANGDKKHYPTDYKKTRPEYMDTILKDYLPGAEKIVRQRLENTGIPFDPVAQREQIRMQAFENRQSERVFPNGIKNIDELPPELQRKYMSRAIDAISQIGVAREKIQKNNEEFDSNFYWDDSDLGVGPEPDESDFLTTKEYQAAYAEWEEESQKAREYEEDEARRESFPYNMDIDVDEHIRREITKQNFKVPSWIVKFFAKTTDYTPEMLRVVRHMQYLRKEEEKAKKVKKKIVRPRLRASGWYARISKPQYLLREG